MERDKQVLLLFTSERIIVLRKGWLADITGSGVGAVVGGAVLQVALSRLHSSSQEKRAEEVEKVDLDQLVQKYKGSYAIVYDNIRGAEMKQTFMERWLEIQTSTGKHRFKGIWGDKKQEGFLEYESVARLLENEIPNKFKIITRKKK